MTSFTPRMAESIHGATALPVCTAPLLDFPFREPRSASFWCHVKSSARSFDLLRGPLPQPAPDLGPELGLRRSAHRETHVAVWELQVSLVTARDGADERAASGRRYDVVVFTDDVEDRAG